MNTISAIFRCLTEKNLSVCCRIVSLRRLSRHREAKFLVEDAMMPDVFAVRPDTELATVVEAMAAEKYGCAPIQEKDGRVVGVFTTVDACRLLAELVKEKKVE